MLVVVGLGNSGQRYASNRHNVGFMVVDELIRAYGLGGGRARFQSIVHEGWLAGEKILALKPTTYVNESGRAVGSAMRFYKLTPAHVIAIHDELDLAPGKLRVKTGGGNGGHNGIKSIDAHIGRDYRRVRIGIGHPGHRDRVSGHVLSDFSAEEHGWLDSLIDAVTEAFPLVIAGDDSRFMSRVALLTRRADAPNNQSGENGV